MTRLISGENHRTPSTALLEVGWSCDLYFLSHLCISKINAMSSMATRGHHPHLWLQVFLQVYRSHDWHFPCCHFGCHQQVNKSQMTGDFLILTDRGNLSGEARQSCTTRLVAINTIDPYDLSAKSWSSENSETTASDITNLLVYRCVSGTVSGIRLISWQMQLMLSCDI